MRPAGGNHATLKKYVLAWEISTQHFDPAARSAEHLRSLAGRRAQSLDEILVENSNYSRGSLKKRLYAEGLKRRNGELCGQGEMWRGRQMSLILDHVNGVADDNRLENLRIVCPNCAATLETHCGRNKCRRCQGCGETFRPKSYAQRFCAPSCHKRALRGVPRRRTVQRPPYAQLLAEIRATNYCAVGRKYGVSDNAIRKWVRQYRRERARRVCRAGYMTSRVTTVRLSAAAERA